MRRGYTIAELLVVLVIMGFVSSFVALIVGPLFAAVSSQTAKVDTIQAAEKSFYRIQRDLHQSNMNGVYACTYPAPTTCGAPSATLAGATVLAIITPKANGSGQLAWDNNQGQPQWTGFNVYWVAPDANGVSTLYYKFADPTSGASTSVTSADAAVNIALGATPQVLATSVAALQIDQKSATNTIGLKMFAASTEDRSTNATSFESDTVTRN